MNDRLYSPDDIRRILERAARLQQPASEVDTALGLTMSELEDVALSSGIDPALIQQAVYEMDLPDGEKASMTSTHVHVERVIRGELSDASWQAALVELRRRFEVDGEDTEEIIDSLGATRSWRYVEGDDVKAQVYITPRRGVLHIKMSQKIAWADRLISATVWAVVAALGFGSIIAGQGEGTLFSALSYALVFLLSFLLVLGIDTSRRNSRKREFDLLADSISRTIASERASGPVEAEVTVRAEGTSVPLAAEKPVPDLEGPPVQDTSRGRASHRSRSR